MLGVRDMASPFVNKVFTFTQPDGTEFKVRGSGDQHYAVFETLEGYTVVRNPQTGFYEIADVSHDGTLLEPVSNPPKNLDGAATAILPGVRVKPEAARTQGIEGAQKMGGRRCDQRREQYKSLAKAARILNGPVMAPPKRETVGDFVGLCLLIDFPGEPGIISRDEVEKFCNESGYSGFGNNGSVHDYFHDNSIGRCRYTNIVADYYTAQHPKSHYTDPNINQGIRARQLIVEALTHLEADGFDFTQLTEDSEGFVYALNVYYAGGVVNNWSEGLWPHAWHLASPVLLASGKSAFDYQFTDMSQELSLGTFCHENGHMLCDYPDLYDYGNESGGAGAYCLMCAGGSVNEKNPVHISAYLKRLSGWAEKVIPIQPNQEISLVAGKNEFAIFSKDSGEYFIIENRLKEARDISLPDEGLAVWHVDEEGNNSNQQMTPSQHYELSLEQADGEFHLESSRHIGDATDLFGKAKNHFAEDTTPNSKWWDGSESGLRISQISLPGAVISFQTSDDAETKIINVMSAPALDIPDNQAAGISDTISVEQDGVITDVEVELDISHTYRGDLRVILLTPWGEPVVLHLRHQGGREDNIQRKFNASNLQALATLNGHNVKGDWQLQVQDLAVADVGVLNHWQLEFSTIADPQTLVVFEEVPGVHIPDADLAGIKRTLLSDATAHIGSIEVFVDITHTWIGDLQISLTSPDGTRVMLHNATGDGTDNITQTYTIAMVPELSGLIGQAINGAWQLHLVDSVGQDFGKLNAWRVAIHPQ